MISSPSSKNNSSRTALITGAAQRLGRRIALALAGEGWDIAIHYNRSDWDAQKLAADIEDIGRKAHLIQADLMEQDAPQRIFKACRNIGPIGALINNASLFTRDTFPEIDADSLTRHYQVNCAAPLMLMQEFARAAQDGRDNCIVNMLDMMVLKSPKAFTSYILSKKALYEATLIAAATLSPKVRVNGILPGAILPEKESGKDPSPAQESAAKRVTDSVLDLLNGKKYNGAMLKVENAEDLNQNRILGPA